MKITRALKGKLRCFQCRAELSPKDGSWVDLRNQQVFLCKVCEQAHLAQGSSRKTPASAFNK